MKKLNERTPGTAIGITGNNGLLTEVRNSNPSGAAERNRVSQYDSNLYRF